MGFEDHLDSQWLVVGILGADQGPVITHHSSEMLVTDGREVLVDEPVAIIVPSVEGILVQQSVLVVVHARFQWLDGRHCASRRSEG